MSDQSTLKAMSTILGALRFAALSNDRRAKDAQFNDLARAAFRRDAKIAREVVTWINDGTITIQAVAPPGPLEIPGGEIIHTGGNCTAIMIRRKYRGYILLTQPDNARHPLTNDTHIDVGVYDCDLDRDADEAVESYLAMPVAAVLSRLGEWTEKR